MSAERFIPEISDNETDFRSGRDQVGRQTPELPHDPDFDYITKWHISEEEYKKIQKTKEGGE